MPKTTTLSVRMDPNLKREAEQIFRALGLTPSQAVTLFYKQVEIQGGLPFDVRLPNRVTVQALEEAADRRNLEAFDSPEALFDDLGI